MKCPLCDEEFEDLVEHFDSNHGYPRTNGPGILVKYEGVTFTCMCCKTIIPTLARLAEHWHSDEHLYKTGKIQEKIKNLNTQTIDLKQKLADQTKKTIKAEQDKIEILQAGYAKR